MAGIICRWFGDGGGKCMCMLSPYLSYPLSHSSCRGFQCRISGVCDSIPLSVSQGCSVCADEDTEQTVVRMKLSSYGVFVVCVCVCVGVRVNLPIFDSVRLLGWNKAFS